MKKYIASIDGLRGYAVLAVILYHAFPTYFPGGFVGVDIFFVISGFVITRKLLVEAQTKKLNLIEFFFDRVKRLIPLLAIVVYSTSILAVIYLTPSELVKFAESLISNA